MADCSVETWIARGLSFPALAQGLNAYFGFCPRRFAVGFFVLGQGFSGEFLCFVKRLRLAECLVVNLVDKP